MRDRQPVTTIVLSTDRRTTKRQLADLAGIAVPGDTVVVVSVGPDRAPKFTHWAGPGGGAWTRRTEPTDPHDLVVLLDDRATLVGDWLSELTGFLSHPAVDAVAPRTNIAGGDELLVGVPYRPAESGTRHEFARERLRTERGCARRAEVFDGPCVGVRRQWFDAAGGLDALGTGSLGIAELTAAIRREGGGLLVSEACYAHHRGGPPWPEVATASPAARPLVSACMIVRDEAQNLPRALGSLAGVADELVVYDTGSTDDTVRVAREAGAVVVEGYWDDDFSRARNDALASCRGQWILWLDADEALVCEDVPALRAHLLGAPAESEGCVLLIDNLRGTEAATVLTHPACRLFRRACGHWSGRVHEQVVARAGSADLALEIHDGARITHWGYLQHALAGRDKGERNVRNAFADLVAGDDDLEPALRLVSLGRSRMLAGQYEEGLDLCRRAAATAGRPTTVRLALRAVVEGELALGRNEEALEDAARLKKVTAKPTLAHVLEGRARLALGEHEAALEAFDAMQDGLDDDGFEYGGHFVAAERATALMGLERFGDAADVLLDSLRHHGGLDTHIGALVESLDRAGRPLVEVPGAMAPERLDAFLPQVLQLEAEAGDRLLEACWESGLTTRSLLATAVPLAARLPVARQLVWSSRLRDQGLASACPLVAGVTDLGRPARERVQGAAAASAMFADRRARLGFAAAVPSLAPDERGEARAEVAAIEPRFLAVFDVFAGVTGAPSAAVATGPWSGRRVLVVDDKVANLRTLALSAVLARFGHAVTVVHPQPAAGSETLLGPAGVTVHGWREQPEDRAEGWTRPCLRFLARLYAEHPYDVVVLASSARPVADGVAGLMPAAHLVVDLDAAPEALPPVFRAAFTAVADEDPAMVHVGASAPALFRPPPPAPLDARSGVCVVGDFRHATPDELTRWSERLAPALGGALGDTALAVVGDDPGRTVANGYPGALSVGPVADPRPWLRAARLVLIPFHEGAAHWLVASVMCGTTALVVPDDPQAAAQLPAAAAALLADDDLWHRFAVSEWPDLADPPVDPLRSLPERRRPSAPTGERPLVAWTGGVFSRQSLHQVNRELVRRLACDGDFEVTVVSGEPGPHPADTAAALAGVHVTAAREVLATAALEVRHQWPPDFSVPASGRLVLIQPWEFGGLPAEWIGALRDVVDELWVPTSWVRSCAVDSGVPADKVHVVPNGVDVDRFNPSGPPFPLATTKSTKFLFVGGCVERKGIDALLETYLTTFGPDDDVCLVVKPFGTDGVYRTSSLEDSVRRAAAGHGPQIEMVDGDLTLDQMAALYRTCDVLVHPYRGEGFGLPIAEAMASGLAVVVTDGGACRDFCDEDNAWLVPARRVAIAPREWTPVAAGSWWLEPSRQALADALREAAGAPELVERKGATGRRRIEARFTWDHAAAVADDRIRALLGVPAAGRLARHAAAVPA